MKAQLPAQMALFDLSWALVLAHNTVWEQQSDEICASLVAWYGESTSSGSACYMLQQGLSEGQDLQQGRLYRCTDIQSADRACLYVVPIPIM